MNDFEKSGDEISDQIEMNNDQIKEYPPSQEIQNEYPSNNKFTAYKSVRFFLLFYYIYNYYYYYTFKINFECKNSYITNI